MKKVLPSLIEGYNPKCRVRMIDLPHSEESGREFKNIKDLNDHLKGLEAVPWGQRCRVYVVVENLTLEYIAAFGYYLNVDPTFFARQIRTANWDPVKHQNSVCRISTNPSIRISKSVFLTNSLSAFRILILGYTNILIRY